MMSLHGLDHLSFDKPPDFGTYATPKGSFHGAATKAKAGALYKSNTCRFSPARNAEDTASLSFGRPEKPWKGSPRSILGTTDKVNLSCTKRFMLTGALVVLVV